MTRRRGITDAIAVVGVGTTPYRRDAGRSAEALAVEATAAAIHDAGLGADDIDGICGTTLVPSYQVQTGLGLGGITWYESLGFGPGSQLAAAAYAISSGACETAVFYHVAFRAPGISQSAAADPLRRRAGQGANVPGATPETITPAVGYAAWAGRHMHEFGTTREHLGLIAINGRTHAMANPHAALRTPLTMADYLAARMVRTPFGLYDMDYPIDGADAIVLTTVERARDLRQPLVLLHALGMGQPMPAEPDQMASLACVGADIAAAQLWAKSEIDRAAIDLVYAYDGFTIIPLVWLEALGWCRRGEGGPFLQSQWNTTRDRLELGRVLLNTHGGSLSEGGTQGIGLIREATTQLRRQAGDRQVEHSSTAVVAPGGFLVNSAAMILRVG